MLNSEELINKVKVYNKFLNPEKLNKAYDFAVRAHSNQKRASGDPYSVHPIEVANILTDLKLDSATITTGLLHDTIEDTFATYETIKGEFGDEVADLVDGVTKISVLENTATINSKAENFRKLILATSKDIRVLLVKIADRLHNMRTIKAISKEDKRKRIAQETMEIYAPLADRMGMHRIRDELEDLSFEILNNDARSLIQKRLDEIKIDKKDIYENLSSELKKLLSQNNFKAWQNQISYVSQNSVLLDDTIRNNITFFDNDPINEEKLKQVIEHSQLSKFLKELPKGIDTSVGDLGNQLSGGQVQRIAIARALYKDREVLILDEPTSALDSNNEKKIIQNILDQEKTIILISHNIDNLKKCHSVYELKDKKIVLRKI